MILLRIFRWIGRGLALLAGAIALVGAIVCVVSAFDLVPQQDFMESLLFYVGWSWSLGGLALVLLTISATLLTFGVKGRVPSPLKAVCLTALAILLALFILFRLIP